MTVLRPPGRGMGSPALASCLSPRWTLTSAASRQDVPGQEGDDDNRRGNSDDGDSRSGYDHTAILAPLSGVETRLAGPAADLRHRKRRLPSATARCDSRAMTNDLNEKRLDNLQEPVERMESELVELIPELADLIPAVAELISARRPAPMLRLVGNCSALEGESD